MTSYQPHEYLKMDFHVPHPNEENPGFTTVEVRFTVMDGDHTQVELAQSNGEALRDVAEMVQQGYGEMVQQGYGTAWEMIFKEADKNACAAKA